jgi:hypothetical protein
MQIEILSIVKPEKGPDKGNVKIVANVLNPPGVPHESSYTAGNATAEECVRGIAN